MNAKDSEGWTPLHVAAQWGQKDTAKLLIDKNAAIGARTKIGITPLIVACNMLQTDVVTLLLSERADVTLKDDEGRSPLFAAILYDEKSITSLGVKKGNPKEIAEMLLKKKADPSTMNALGKTILSIATAAGQTEIVALLKQYGGAEPEIINPAE